MANEISQVAQLGICLMVMFLVVRHTRAEEESGRAELLRSTVIGRHAATVAGLLYGVSAALLIGLVTTGSMLAAGLDEVGSVTYGVGLTLLGLSYAAISLVAAQLSTSARGALGLTALGLLYGAVIPTIPDLVASNPDIAQAFGASADAEQGLIDAFLRYIFLFMAVISTGFAVTSVLRLRTEEESGRAEAVLATRVRRTSWVSATVLVSGVG